MQNDLHTLIAGKSGDSLSLRLVVDSSFPFRASRLVAIATQHIASTHTVHRHEARGTRHEAYSDQSSYCLSNSAWAKGNAGIEWRQAADSRRRPKVECWTGEKSINRWPFGTLLLIITIDSEFSTKRSFAHPPTP